MFCVADFVFLLRWPSVGDFVFEAGGSAFDRKKKDDPMDGY